MKGKFHVWKANGQWCLGYKRHGRPIYRRETFREVQAECWRLDRWLRMGPEKAA